MRKRMKEKTLYLSEQENEILIKKCNKSGLSKSEYIRRLIDNYTPIKTDINILTKYNQDLKMIGNGLNAVARDSNKYGFINTKDFTRYLTWMNEVVDDIKFNLEIE